MTLKNPHQTYFFKELEDLKITQTSLFLLNHINIFKNISNNLSTLTYLHNENLINSYLFNKEVEYNYASDVIYLVFKKDVKYLPNVNFNKNNVTILEVLEEIPQTLDYYENDLHHVFAIKPDNEIFNIHVNLLLKGLYKSMKPLHSSDIVSNFINNLIKKEGLYKIIQSELHIKNIPHPFLKLSIDKETYDPENFNPITFKDFQLLKKYT